MNKQLIELLRILPAQLEEMSRKDVDLDNTTVSGYNKWLELVSLMKEPMPELARVISKLERISTLEDEITGSVKFIGDCSIAEKIDATRKHQDDADELPAEEPIPKKQEPEKTETTKEKLKDVSPGYRPIRGVRFVEDDAYAMSATGVVVSRRKGHLVPKRLDEKNGNYYYEFPAKKGTTRIEAAWLLDQIWGTGAKSPIKPTTKPPEWVWVDWIHGIPGRKYKINTKGEIYDCVRQVLVKAGERPSSTGRQFYVKLSAGEDTAGKSSGVGRAYSTDKRVATLVWQAYNPEDRDTQRLCLRYIDGDTKNHHLGNLARLTDSE